MSANLEKVSGIKGKLKMFRGKFLSQRDKEGKSHCTLITNFNNMIKKQITVNIW